MRIAALAVICVCLGACVTAARSDDHDRTCAAFAELFTTPATTAWPQLEHRDDERVRAMSTTRLAQGGYVCGDRVYQEAGRGSQVFFDIGFSANKRYASVGMGSADFGHRCLLRRTAEHWTVVGCTMLWIT
jgi:hypothetical protein